MKISQEESIQKNPSTRLTNSKVEDFDPKAAKKTATKKNALRDQHNKLSVSKAFRKTCYKCGNLGHHAEECEHEERLCYNCKKPGHESSDCLGARNSDVKQCFYCQEIGHIQSKCPKTKKQKQQQQPQQQQKQQQQQQQQQQHQQQHYHQQRQSYRHLQFVRRTPSFYFPVPQSSNLINYYFPAPFPSHLSYITYDYNNYYQIPENAQFQPS